MKGARQNKRKGAPKEPLMEQRLYALFKIKRDSGRSIGIRWFNRNARQIYEEIHPERVIKDMHGRRKYTGFRFSSGWFTGFRKRYYIAIRAPTKKAQAPPYNLQHKIIQFLRFNRRNSQLREGETAC